MVVINGYKSGYEWFCFFELSLFYLVCYYSEPTMMAKDEMLEWKGEMSQMLRQMNKTFYSNNEIFLRELINNASNVSSTFNLISICTFVVWLNMFLIP